MKKTFLKNINTFIPLLMIAILISFASITFALASICSFSVSADTAAIELQNKSTLPPVYAEVGSEFDFDSLPQSIKVSAFVDDGEAKPLDVFIEWNITDENKTDAKAGKDFKLSGQYTHAKSADNVQYPVSGDTDVSCDVIFTQRCGIKNLSVKLMPYYNRDKSRINLIDVTLIINGNYSLDADSVLEYSLGNGFAALNIPLSWEYIQTDDDTPNYYSVFLSFPNSEISDPNETSFSNEQLIYMVTKIVHFRLKVTGGLFDGYSNTVTIAEGALLEKEADNDSNNNNNSGILPPRDPHTGSHGGGTSFWTTNAGTVTAVVIAVISIVASIAIGYFISIFLNNKKRKKSGDDDD